MYKKLIVSLILLLLVQCSISSLILSSIQKNDIKNDLKKKISRAKEDIRYADNQWNIDRYNSDPQLLGNYPLYILTIDGFVLDRRNPIKGFLDSANFDNLLSYENPQTVTSIAGNTRRTFSKTISDKNNEVVALVAVSYLEPQEQALEKIDQRLRENADLIISRIRVNEKTIDTDHVDEREIPYEISFLIVDKYNSTLLKSTNVNNRKRIPTFIDPSYVKKSLDNTGFQIIKDAETNKQFLVLTEPLIKNNQTLGVIAVGSSLENMQDNIRNFALLSGLLSIVLLAVFAFYLKRMRKDKSILDNQMRNPSKIRFDTKQSLLFIDNQQIEFAYATNQYYLLRSLFANPLKRFETDELLEQFGEVNTQSDGRKVYDTMTNINKKVAGYLREKLIINQNKTYQLNPKLPIEKAKK
jgi:hypothetical protein